MAAAFPTSTPAAKQEGLEYTAQYGDPNHAGNTKASNKNRAIKIGIVSILALVILGAGSYALFSVTRSGTAIS